MNYTCPICNIDPSSHSFTKLRETDNLIYFYACPSKAKLYFDKEGILNHYTGMLNEIPKGKKWVWIFDSNEFGFKHIINFDIAIELAKLISTFNETLERIIIINPTFYISHTYTIIYPFLHSKIKKLIEFNYTDITSDNILI